jgi:hypothetical protein
MLLKILVILAVVLAIIVLLLKINSNSNFNPNSKIRILMIGDSYTFKNNMPSIFQSILGHKYQVDSHVIPKLNLTVAYNDQNVKNMIINGKYNFVILQEHSARIIMATKSFKEAVQNFITLIKNNGSHPVLFEPWAYTDKHPDYKPNPVDWQPPVECPLSNTKSDILVKAPFCYRLKCRDKTKGVNYVSKVTAAICSTDYNTTSKKVQAFTKKECDDLSGVLPIIYIGEAIWGYKDTSILFNLCDEKHPTLAGSYLIALLLYKYFTGKNVTLLSSKVTGCIDCPITSTLPNDWKKCFDCCYKPSLNSGCGKCNNPDSVIDPNIVKNLQEYVSTLP